MNAKAFLHFLPLLCTFVAGCGGNDTIGESVFDIPPSIVDRMRVCYNSNRNKLTGSAASLDGDQMMALMHLGYGGAHVPV